MDDTSADIDVTYASTAMRAQLMAWNFETLEEHQRLYSYAYPPQHQLQDYQNRVFSHLFDSGLMQEADNGFLWVAKVNDVLAGYILISVAMKDTASDVRRYIIVDIYVAPEYRTKGVGSALLQHVRAIAIAEKWDDLHADVWSQNAASRRLFEQVGFDQRIISYRMGSDRPLEMLPEKGGMLGFDRNAIIYGLVAIAVIAYIFFRR